MKKVTRNISDSPTLPAEGWLTYIQLVRIELQKACDYIKVQDAEMEELKNENQRIRPTIGRYQGGQRESASNELPTAEQRSIIGL